MPLAASATSLTELNTPCRSKRPKLQPVALRSGRAAGEMSVAAGVDQGFDELPFFGLTNGRIWSPGDATLSVGDSRDSSPLACR